MPGQKPAVSAGGGDIIAFGRRRSYSRTASLDIQVLAAPVKHGATIGCQDRLNIQALR